MRSTLLVFGVLAGAINTLMVGRYGFVTSDTAIDGAIAAFYFGIIALGAIGGPAVAVHFLARRRWVWGGAFALLAAVALCANVVNSLGALAGRSDKTQAERARARDDARDDKAQLARISAERAAMVFAPATEESVQAARGALATAERNRLAECGANNEKRGTRCREREAEEQAKQDALTAVLAAKALTDKATRLDGKGPPLKLANGGLGPAGTASSAGDQLQPWRRMKDAHQCVHQRHPVERRRIVHGHAEHVWLAVGHDCPQHHQPEGWRSRQTEPAGCARSGGMAAPNTSAYLSATRVSFTHVGPP